MEILLVIIAGIFLIIVIGNILENKDKKKEKKRQLDITNAALNNMRQHRYETKGEFHCGWSLVKLDDYRYAYVDCRGNYLNDALFTSATEFEITTLAPSGNSLISLYLFE